MEVLTSPATNFFVFIAYLSIPSWTLLCLYVPASFLVIVATLSNSKADVA
ncbi:hypothetical protein HMPREF0294_1705 [Corynebacterium glucuronolyticum ATCC 51867]|nr:hypothetical protein HMPREF0294_1705 [Corynebacterium glucuronolyticum ATCC 51867]